MPLRLHDPATRDDIRARVKKISSASTRQWGKMSPDQMLWHVNQALAQALGQIQFGTVRGPLPIPLMKFMVFRMPWPKGVQTAPELVADAKRPNLAAERARCLDLIDAFVAKDMNDSWATSFILGKMSGKEWSCLHARHLDHHLKQFGA